ncbi:type VII secretion target [Actinokineospora bangkokensis]|uniref:ESX-1 secretion-associated protein n=1 Tax=Actinokineospora bangkokensis TaxID=1193682 RepID=A0A1Q9LF07_9PSEU|nr:type VII secretion target [Actinokineospora bangkokensis]OLR90608.1 hypothetical protein BJP25_28765 [Actinokineospora bangkokensis]
MAESIRVDPTWVGQYAKSVGDASEVLASCSTTLQQAPLTAESFGALGNQVRVTESYLRAADALRTQLARGVEALKSASASLGQVAEKYQTSDDDGVVSLNRSGQA